MSGKKRQKGSGGARPGAGRPRKVKTISKQAKARWWKAAQVFQKEHGVSVERVILEMIVEPNVQDTVKVGCAKLYNEALIAKETRTDLSTNRTARPVIYIPECWPDPALQAVKGERE